MYFSVFLADSTMIECQYCNTLLKTHRSYEIHLIRDHNHSVED